MYEDLIRVLNFTNNIKDFTNLLKLQKDLITLIDSVDKNIYRLVIYAVDDKMINYVGYVWLEHLLEKKYFKTDIGGNMFYNYIKEYINDKEYSLLFTCAIILKNGFKGCYDIWQYNIYSEVMNILHLNQPAILKVYSPYVPHIQYNKLISWWWIILPIILTIIIIQVINLCMFLLTSRVIISIL